MTVSFANPTIFVLMVVPVALFTCYLLYSSWKRRLEQSIGDPSLVTQMTESHSKRREVAGVALAILALVLLVFGLAAPQWGEKQRRVERSGIDIVFALDISRSMLAEDIPPSRLNAARREIELTLNRLSGDRVGLVVFAGIAFSQCPLTTDYSAIRGFLQRTQPEDLPIQGTAIGRAIEESVTLLKGQRFRDPAQSSRREMTRGHDQIVVLFTDAEDHEGGFETSAAAALAEGIRVFSVPVGSAEGGEIPRFVRGGRRDGVLRDRHGQLVLSRVDFEVAEAIASAGGGLSIPYAGEGSVATVLGNEVDRLQAAELADILKPEREDRFYFFLAPALVLLALSTLISDRRRPNGNQFGRQSLPLLLLLLASLAGLTGCEEAFVFNADKVQRGLTASEEGRNEEAIELLEGFRRELAPENLLDERALNYNEGLIQYRAGNLETARQRFLTALGSRDEEVQFRSYFNLGNINFLEEDWEGAYQRYMQALAIRPEDEDAKWNLELALRRMFPPCSAFEDPYEDNDRPEDAVPLPSGEASLMMPGLTTEPEDPPALVLCGLDPDWYIISDPALMADARLTVEVQFERLREDTGGAALPNQIPADAIRLVITEADGLQELALAPLSAPLAADEPMPMLDARAFTIRIEDLIIPAESLQQDHLLLGLEANMGLEFTYQVEFTVIPPCSALDDHFEDNDTRFTAAPIEAGEFPLHICPGDQDWFRFGTELGDTVFVDITPGPESSPPSVRPRDRVEANHTVGLRAELYRAGDDAPLEVAFGRDGMLELAVFDIEEPTDYELRIVAIEPWSEGPYLLELYVFPPCIAGDDQFHGNYSLENAAELDPAMAPFRHLRICEEADWFLIPFDEDEEFTLEVTFEEEQRPLNMVLYDPAEAETEPAWAQRYLFPDPPDRPDNELTPPPPRARVLLELSDLAGSEALYPLQIWGKPGFYNLDIPTRRDDESDGSCDNPDSSEQDQSDQQGDSSSEEQEDGLDDPERQPPEAQDEPDYSDQQERSPDDHQDRSDQEEQDLQTSQDESEAQPSEEEIARMRLQQLLDSLSDEDVNLQLLQALEQVDLSPREREW